MSNRTAPPAVLVVDAGARATDWLADWARRRATDVASPLVVREPGGDIAETVRRVRRAQGNAPLGVVVADDANALIAIEAGADDAIPERRLDASSVLAFIDTVCLRARLRHEREQARASTAHADRLAALGVLVASIAHEANNPLTSLLLSTDVLRLRRDDTPSLDPELDEILGEIEASGLAVARIIQDLKLFSRPSDEDAPEVVDVRALIARVLQIVGRHVRAYATVELDQQAELPPVLAAPDQLAQVLTNVLLNAAHAVAEVGPRAPRIRIATRHDDEAIAISVSDTGPGIPPEALEHIFDPFFTTKAATGGTGLGLAISRDLMRRMGGDLLVESVHGDGATFIAILPRPDAAELAAAHARQPRTPDAAPAPPPGRRILVVDADESVLRALARSLEPSYEVLLATDGQEAIDLLRSGSEIDAVVIDGEGPASAAVVLRGWLLRQEQPLLPLAARMVVLSMRDRDDMRFEPPDPAPLVVEKPVSRKTLLEALGRAIVTSE